VSQAVDRQCNPSTTRLGVLRLWYFYNGYERPDAEYILSPQAHIIRRNRVNHHARQSLSPFARDRQRHRMPRHVCLARLLFISAETIDGLFSNPSSKPLRRFSNPPAEKQIR
jgi:hypothetical protein